MFDIHHKPDAFRLLVSPYHPDTLRHPASGRDSTPSDRLRHAMTWNVFKTLEQIAPGRWMRSLLAMAAGLPDGYDSAPHIAAVTCWSTLPPPPSAMLRRGRRQAVAVNAIVDTDDTVITFVTPSPTALLDTVLSETAESGLAEVAEATAYLAGTRSAYVSVVLPIEVDEQVWAPRVRRRADRVKRLLASGGRSLENIGGIGTTTWHALHELLSDLSQSRFISETERRCAMSAATWMNEGFATEVARKRLA